MNKVKRRRQEDNMIVMFSYLLFFCDETGEIGRQFPRPSVLLR